MGANNSFLPVSDHNPVLPFISSGMGLFWAELIAVRFRYLRLAQGEGWRNTMNLQA
jgi:hypothetical protein